MSDNLAGAVREEKWEKRVRVFSQATSLST